MKVSGDGGVGLGVKLWAGAWGGGSAYPSRVAAYVRE